MPAIGQAVAQLTAIGGKYVLGKAGFQAAYVDVKPILGFTAELIQNLAPLVEGKALAPAAIEQELARRFTADRIIPNAAEWDEKHIFPRDVIKEAAELGFARALVRSGNPFDALPLFDEAERAGAGMAAFVRSPADALADWPRATVNAAGLARARHGNRHLGNYRRTGNDHIVIENYRDNLGDWDILSRDRGG